MDLLIQACIQGLLLGGAYALIALCLGLSYNVSGIINFAHGDFLSLAMFLAFGLSASFALDPYVSIVLTLPLLAGLGALVYWFLLRPIAASHTLMVIQLTLGLAFVLQNGVLMGFGGQPLRTPSMVESEVLVVGGAYFIRLPQLIAFLASLVLSAILYVVLEFTDAGRRIKAVHQSPRAAALMGINVQRVRLVTFAVGIGLLALAGTLLVPGTPIHPSQGLRYTVIALMCLVLGGMTNFAGIFLGAMVIGLTEALGTVYVSGTSGMILPYGVFVLVLLFRPQGLLGRA